MDNGNKFDDNVVGNGIEFDDDKLLSELGVGDTSLDEDITFDDDYSGEIEEEDESEEEVEEDEEYAGDEETVDESEDDESEGYEETETEDEDDESEGYEETEDSEYEKEDSDYDVVSEEDSILISSTGDIIVQDNVDSGENFVLKYIEISNIAVVKRIRLGRNVESLVQSIKSTGLLKPIVVAPLETEGLYVLIDGYRRILACAKAGLKTIPCVVNTKISTPDVPILEALYNHSKSYSIKEMVAYIDYLEKEKNILSASMIEYLLQMDSGDYTKLKDILNDNDDDIVSALMEGQLTIGQAFKKLEQRRKKESKEEQELRKTDQVYGDAEESGVDKLAGSGEEADESVALTDEEIAELSITTEDINSVDDKSLDDMVEEGKSMEGFEPHKQNPNEREIIDPAIRKAVMSKYNNTCQCCGRGGPDYVDILDLHHIVEVYLGGVDSVENSVVLCLNCHRQVHLWSFSQLHIPSSKSNDELEAEVIAKIAEKNAENKSKGKEALSPEEEEELREIHFAVYKQEQNKYKRIVLFGNVIRKGLQQRNIKLEQAKKEHPIDKIGRNKPGQKNTIA